jgi:hypothetical protein
LPSSVLPLPCSHVSTSNELRIQPWIRFEPITRPKQFEKTPSPAPTLEATNKVISFSRLKKPKTPFFPGPLNFFCSNDAAIGWSVRVVLLKMIKEHTKTPIIDNHCIADKGRNGHCVFSETRLYEATHLKVTEIFTMKFDFDDFWHPAISK